jgi:hypothetical protein
MTTKTKTTRLRTILISLFTLGAVAGSALAYDARISPKDIVDAGGYCVGERCYLNGRAYQCVYNVCKADRSA